MGLLPCRLSSSFMPWRDKSVRCEPQSCSTRKVCPVLNNATEPIQAQRIFARCALPLRELRKSVQLKHSFPFEQTSIEQEDAHRDHTAAIASLRVFLMHALHFGSPQHVGKFTSPYRRARLRRPCHPCS